MWLQLLGSCIALEVGMTLMMEFSFFPLLFYVWVGFLKLSKSFKEEITLDEKYAIL